MYMEGFVIFLMIFAQRYFYPCWNKIGTKNKTKQKTKQNKTKQNKTKQNKTNKQTKTKQNKQTNKNKTKQKKHPFVDFSKM